MAIQNLDLSGPLRSWKPAEMSPSLTMAQMQQQGLKDELTVETMRSEIARMKREATAAVTKEQNAAKAQAILNQGGGPEELMKAGLRDEAVAEQARIAEGTNKQSIINERNSQITARESEAGKRTFDQEKAEFDATEGTEGPPSPIPVGVPVDPRVPQSQMYQGDALPGTVPGLHPAMKVGNSMLRPTSLGQKADAASRAKQSELDMTRTANEYTVTGPDGKPMKIPKDVWDNMLTQQGQNARQDDQQTFTAGEGQKNRDAAAANARTMAAARIQAVKDAGLNGELNPKQMSSALALANSLKAHPAYTDMIDISTGISGVESGLSQKSGLGDITAINSFQRMVDPGATVRSEDVGLIRSASAILDRVFSEYPIEKLRAGAVLPAATREELRKTAMDLYERRAKNYNDMVGTQYKGLAKAGGIPFEFVGADFVSRNAPSANPAPAPTDGGFRIVP